MDYKQEYLKLKQLLLNQRGSGKMNPLLLNNLSSMVFIVGNNILGDDVKAVIISLIEEFNLIASQDLRHNIELSQYYAVGRGLMTREGTIQCENCELVLKYTHSSVCLSNGRIVRKTSGDNEVNCQVSRGMVKFYIKQKTGDQYRYTRIRIARVQQKGSLAPFTDALYLNNDELDKLHEDTGAAISLSHSDLAKQSASRGDLKVKSPSDVAIATKNINKNVDQINRAATESQLGLMNRSRVVSPVPTQTSVNVANTVARNMSIGDKNSAIMVPNNPISLDSSDDVQPVIGAVDERGIELQHVGNGGPVSQSNTLNSKIPVTSAQIPIDANIAVVPSAGLGTSETITGPSKKSTTSVYNKLSQSVSNAFHTDKAQDKVTDKISKETLKQDETGIASSLGKETKNFFGNLWNKAGDTADKMTNWLRNLGSKSTVVPVSKDLSVVTPLPPQKAGFVPVPTNDDSNTNYLQNKVYTNNPPIDMQYSQNAISTVRNGKTNLSLVEHTQDRQSSTRLNPRYNVMY
ncbi:hypothetical protein [Acanthamoeba polyphaga mimivirus]|nr:hypothetical protein [Acanthamoeba castellanii mamavirus]EJN40982.1 hypothetical protein lvs_R479 [Acanthamoeba polyphaga lentillevirus]UMZ07916.1 hypothetical protein [Acanthamoeba polyphaga mimivirus]